MMVLEGSGGASPEIVIKAIGKIGDAKAVDLLLARLSTNLRETIVSAIKNIGISAIESLVTALINENAEVRNCI
jgi:HEAT repeat protein